MTCLILLAGRPDPIRRDDSKNFHITNRNLFNPLPDFREKEVVTVRQMMILQNEIKNITDKTQEEMAKLGRDILEKMLAVEGIKDTVDNKLDKIEKRMDPIEDQVRETAASVNDLKLKASEQIENQKSMEENFKRMSLKDRVDDRKNSQNEEALNKKAKEEEKKVEKEMEEIISVSKKRNLNQKSKISIFTFIFEFLKLILF